MPYNPVAAGDFIDLLKFAEGVAIFNSDDPMVMEFVRRHQIKITTGRPIDLDSAEMQNGLAYFAATNISPVQATAWVANTPYTAGQTCSVGTNVYVCAVPGTSAATGTGPSGTGSGIVDGTNGLTWNYTPTPYLGAGRVPQIIAQQKQ